MPQFASLFCLAVLLSAQSSFAAEWPQWRGPQRDGIAKEPGLTLDWEAKPPQHQWTIEGMGAGYASLSIADGKMYSTGNFDDGQAVVCIDLGTRQRVWKTPLTVKAPEHSFPGSRCTPTLDGPNLYVVTSDGQIACLRRNSGEVVWRKNFKQEWNGKLMSGWGFSEAPLVDGELVLCTPGGTEALVVALNKQTGAEAWRVAAPNVGQGKDGAGYSSIVISEAAGVKQYVQMYGHGLLGIRAADGKVLWTYDKVANGTANIPTPLCHGDFVFASTSYNAGAALVKLSRDGEGVKAEEVYFLEGKTFQNHHGGMIMQGDFVYAGHQQNKGFPICVHWPSGEVKWGGDIRPVGSGSAAITAVNNQLIFRYEDGTVALIAASPDSYQLKGSFRPEYQQDKSWSHPVVLDGKLYLREQDKLMCYQL